MFSPRVMTLVMMILAAAATRVLPHPWNFTAVGAMCLFGGAKFSNRWAAMLAPMIALLISDVVIAYTQYSGNLGTITGFNYLLFALITASGMLLQKRENVLTIGGAAIVAATGFFLLSNLNVWLGGQQGYAMTWAGLLECYVKGLPFYRNQLGADLLYSAVLFGGFYFLKEVWPALDGARGELAYQSSGVR